MRLILSVEHYSCFLGIEETLCNVTFQEEKYFNAQKKEMGE